MDEPTRIDGRTARGQRTRSAVVDALLALQEEGDLEPTAQRVAARAGVALRTVFGHFSDMETLWAQAGERELAKIAALADVPSGDLPLDERFERFCASRARVLEAVLPVFRAARLREHASAALRRNREIFAEAGDAEVGAVFATELAPLDASERAMVLARLPRRRRRAGLGAAALPARARPRPAADVLRRACGAPSRRPAARDAGDRTAPPGRARCPRPAATLSRRAEEALERLGDHPSLCFEGTWHTSGELAARARRAAAGFAASACGPGTGWCSSWPTAPRSASPTPRSGGPARSPPPCCSCSARTSCATSSATRARSRS